MGDHVNDARRWLEVLGLAPGATRQQLDQAYRDLVKVWHPDRFESDPLLRLKTQEKLRELNAAYEGLRRAGIPLRDPAPAARVQTPPPPTPERPPTPQPPPTRAGEVRLFGGVLVATAAIVGALLFFGMPRDAIRPAEIVVTPDVQPEATQPQDAQRSQTVPPPPIPPAQPSEPSEAVAPTTSPATPTSGVLIVMSQPTGAAVYLNDKQVGRTPLTLPSIAPGAYRVRLELDGYAIWSSPVRIEAGASEKLVAFIEKRGDG
jgi:hypothetical protein